MSYERAFGKMRKRVRKSRESFWKWDDKISRQNNRFWQSWDAVGEAYWWKK